MGNEIPGRNYVIRGPCYKMAKQKQALTEITIPNRFKTASWE